MCVYSMVVDHYTEKWTEWTKPNPAVPVVPPTIVVPMYPPARYPTAEELEEFRKLLERAREYDRKTGQPDCELDEKKRKIKELADQLGVKVDFIDEPPEAASTS